MRLRLALLVSLLTIVLASVSEAEWEWWDEDPQSFESSDNYVIAVGKDEDNLRPVQASHIVKALEEGKEIRLKYAEIQEDLRFGDEIKQDVYFVGVAFSGDANFRPAMFSGEADFRDAKFSGEADFGAVTFSGKAIFRDAKFSGKANFFAATFPGNANFRGAKFSGEADFGSVTFPRLRLLFTIGSEHQTDLDIGDTLTPLQQKFENNGFPLSQNAQVQRQGSEWRIDDSENGQVYIIREEESVLNIYFSGRAIFRATTFSGNADFKFARFLGDADFREANFEKPSDFTGCTYSEEGGIFFVGVTGFSQMKIDWENDENDKGLKGRLEYDETFYIALIKNYTEMGWLTQADDAYYTYQVEKRNRLEKAKPVNPWYRRWVEYILLDFSFGYGVKPWKLLRSFLILWIPFSIYYALCLRYKPSHKALYRASSTRRFLRSFYDKWWRFLWGSLHSFDTLTPGIELRSLKSLEQSRYNFKEESKWITRVGRVQKLLGWYLLALFFILFGKIWIR